MDISKEPWFEAMPPRKPKIKSGKAPMKNTLPKDAIHRTIMKRMKSESKDEIDLVFAEDELMSLEEQIRGEDMMHGYLLVAPTTEDLTDLMNKREETKMEIKMIQRFLKEERELSSKRKSDAPAADPLPKKPRLF